MTDPIKTVSSKHFQSMTPNFGVHYATCPPGTSLDDVYAEEFWAEVVARPTVKATLHIADIVRLRASDGAWDQQLVIQGFRPGGAPILAEWPIDGRIKPSTLRMPKVEPQPRMLYATPRDRSEALDCLGLHQRATKEMIEKVLSAQRGAWHPDRATDETDRAARECRLRMLNAAAELLQGKRAAA